MPDSRGPEPRLDGLAAAASVLPWPSPAALVRSLLPILAGAAIALIAALLMASARPDAFPPPATLLAWIGLLALTESLAVPLNHGRWFKVSLVFDASAVVLFGPLAAAWMGVASRALVHGIVRPRPTGRVILSLAAGVLAAFAGGFAYRALGGGSTFTFTPRDVLAFMALGFIWLAVSAAVEGLVFAVETGRRWWSVWRESFLLPLVFEAGVLPIGVLALLLVNTWGTTSLILLALPLFFARSACALEIRVERDLSGFAAALVDALGQVDPYTGQHSGRVAAYAERLARALERSEGEVKSIRLAGLLHDIGKVTQERALLQKPGPLAPDERRRLEAHPVAGADILTRIRALEPVATLVRHHHERADGGGYPARLRGEAIPFGSRVVLVADAFDAMTSDRPYRRGMSGERAVDELRKHAGTQFDSRVVHALVRLRARGEFDVITAGANGRAEASDLRRITDPAS
jgi:putative nucleotidyltransferase with HDIG domain